LLLKFLLNDTYSFQHAGAADRSFDRRGCSRQGPPILRVQETAIRHPYNEKYLVKLIRMLCRAMYDRIYRQQRLGLRFDSR